MIPSFLHIFIPQNEYLLDEQASLTSQCIDKSREWRSNTDKPESLGKDAVVSALLDMWNHRDLEEIELSSKVVVIFLIEVHFCFLKEIHDAIISTEAETRRLQVDVDEWQSFAEYGRKSQQAQLDLLELERVDTITSFNEKKGWLSKKV